MSNPMPNAQRVTEIRCGEMMGFSENLRVYCGRMNGHDGQHSPFVSDKVERLVIDLRSQLALAQQEIERLKGVEGFLDCAKEHIKRLQEELKLAKHTRSWKETKEQLDLHEQIDRLTRERDELANLAGQAIVLRTIKPQAGEKPAIEPSHALTCGVWKDQQTIASLESRNRELRDALQEKQTTIHFGQFHQWKTFDICRRKDCVAARTLLAQEN